MEKKCISIIVPIYNVEKYVEKCLLSLINQTYKNIKIYAIIDGSPDNSVDIVKRIQLIDDRIICIEKENGGYGSVLQYAINLIDTEYFMICDPDDWLETNAVEELATNCFNYNLDIIVGDKYVVSEESDEKKYCNSNSTHDIIKKNTLLIGEELKKMAFLSVSPHSKMYKTALAKSIVFPNKVSYTDFLLYIVVINNSNRGMYIDKALSNYLVFRPGNTTTDKSKKAALNHIIVFNKTIEELNECSDKYIIYKLYEQYRFACLSIVCQLPISDIKEIKNELSCINKLKKHKKGILKMINSSSFVKTFINKIICSMLFNDSLRILSVRILKIIKRRK